VVKTKIIVGVSDARVSSNPSDTIVTYSLGSCIAVTLYDSTTAIGGMLHYQLPDSSIESQRAIEKPLMFADTGMKLLIGKLVSMGAKKNCTKVKIAGGASMDTGPKGFDIGKRNHLAIRKILWKHGMLLDAEDIGGNAPRNMYLDIETGAVVVKMTGQEKQL
jgi:chemotaxis protein CheD